MAFKAAAGESGAFALHCLGDVRLYCGDEDCTPKSRKGRALLAILAAEQRPLSRVKIIDLLWSDRQEEQARASLRTLLADLRSQFDSRFDELLVVERERVALGPAVRTDLTDPALPRPPGELFEGLDHIDPVLDEWLRVERERWRNATTARRSKDSTPLSLSKPAQRSFRPYLAPVLLVSLLALAGLYTWSQRATPTGTVIAVLKFRDVSGRSPQVADGLAEQLRIELAQNPAIEVVAATSSESETVSRADARGKADLLGATHLVEGMLVPHDGVLQLSLRLIESNGQKALWSTNLPATGPALLLGSEPIAPQIADIVGEVARNPIDQRGLAADERAYADYFMARTLSQQEERAKLEQAQGLLLKTLQRHPDFAPALAALSKITMRLSDQTLFGIGSVPVAEAREEARRLGARAIAVAPRYAPAYQARGFADYGLKSALSYYREALRLSPGSASAHQDWAYAMALLQIGHAEDRLRHMRTAARLDPLNASIQFRFIEELTLAGRPAEARAALHRYAARDIPADRRHEVIAQTELLLFGDWSNSYIEASLAKRANPSNATADNLLMWSNLLLYGHQSALRNAKPGSMTELILKDDLSGVIERVGQLGSEFWRSDYEIGAVGHYLNSRGRGDILVDMIDRALAEGAPMRIFLYPDTLAALRERGRVEDVKVLIARGAKSFGRTRGAERLRAAHKIAVLRAQIGDVDGAIAALQVGHRHAWWGLSEILDHPYSLYAFRPLRNDRRFQSLVRDYDDWVIRERQEAVVEAKARGLPPPPTSPPPPYNAGGSMPSAAETLVAVR